MEKHHGRCSLVVGERPFFEREMEVGHVIGPVAPSNLLVHDKPLRRGGVNLSAQGQKRRRSRGKSTVSRTFFAPVNTIRMRSTPKPQPACGGTP